jgi:AAA domain
MTIAEPIGTMSAAPEISWQASELVASWRRVLNQTAGDVRPNLERAAVELLRLSQIEPGSKQAIVDELANLALIGGIDDDEAQAIFARAAEAPPDPINGRPLPASLDLVAKSGQLIASIKAQLGENLPGVLFLDTLNRSLVGSESKDEDMARFLAAAEKVAQELNCAVVIVHHCGIDASRPRGHTSLSGAVESQLKVERTAAGEVIVTVELAKDFAEGTEIVSRLERVELGTDVDGDPITSLVVVPAEASPTARNITRKLSDRQRLALAALDECAAASGGPAPAELQLPARTIVVQLSAWREELYRKGVLDRDAKSPREEFKRVRTSLQARGLIGIRDDLAWKA